MTPPRPTHRGKVALVTGGARRVGRACALALAEAGFDVAITYHQSPEAARAVVAELRKKRRSALAIEADLAQADAAEQVRDALAERFGRLDVLVNNAAIFAPTPLGGLEAAAYDRYQQVNARAPLLLTQVFAAWLGDDYDAEAPATAGRVVNFVDAHVLGRPRRGYSAYSASKAALWQITESLALELAPAVTVNAVAPGVVAWAAGSSQQEKADYLERVPLGRAGTPEDAAAAVRFLATEAHYCTGELIRIDGGRLLG
jgi:pteridine reductase